LTSNSFVTWFIFNKQSQANLAILVACFSCGSGRPVTARSVEGYV
jgi:hypothetical protein